MEERLNGQTDTTDRRASLVMRPIRMAA